MDELRDRVSALLRWDGPPRAPTVTLLATRTAAGYVERLVQYVNAEQEPVRAFLLVPDGPGPFPGVVVHHQHNGERHLGKSEVAGHAGNPLQAFGPALARRGLVVLAPDAVCFEDRRRGAAGVLPAGGDDDQHYGEAVYRLVRGDLLMRVVVADAALAVSVLAALDAVDPDRIGTLGHSMGGHTVLFSAGLDDRVRFACISGALGSYRQRIDARGGIELAQVIPGILAVTDFDGLLSLLAPRPTLVVSATEDPYARDAAAIVAAAPPGDWLRHADFAGGHGLTAERVQAILDWVDYTVSDIRPDSRSSR